MRYRDVAAAVDWLCTAFGFEKQTVLTDDAGATVFAQLTFGRAMFMLAPVRDTAIDKLMKQPDEIGGAETQSGYYVVGDADAHYARAKAAGATVVLDVEDDDFGGRGYTCRDPEGHLWTFGTYDPWQGKYPEPAAVAPASGGGLRGFMLTALTVAAIAAVGVAAWFGGALTQSSAVSSTAQVQPQGVPAPERIAALEAAEQAAREVRAQLERERAARASADKAGEEAQKRAAEAQQAAERTAKEAREQLEQRTAKAADTAGALKRLAEEARAREAAERAVKEARAELDRERRKAAEAPSPDLSKRLAEEARAREAAERAVKEARAELEKARADKTAAEMAKEFALSRAEEEQLAREAAEKAAQEARAQLERQGAGVKSGGPDPAAAKGVADMRRALDEAKKRVGEESRAREAAERAVKEAREQVAKEQSAKTAAWKVIGQLTRQLKQAQGKAASEVGDPDGPAAAPKKARRLKKAEEPDQ